MLLVEKKHDLSIPFDVLPRLMRVDARRNALALMPPKDKDMNLVGLLASSKGFNVSTATG